MINGLRLHKRALWHKCSFYFFDFPPNVDKKGCFLLIHNYTSNIIREDLENSCKKTQPRIVDLCEVFYGVLYLITQQTANIMDREGAIQTC
ncbi:unnamed protein product [Bacillus thuringiensis DB27]|uniref:Uncharacterized protein n=1 Tax=Bacillus thuringiensis DB27 TaxID=1431339 RepID=W8YLQ7_BACTU|nr:unnamed protein product [Bacillus thuringiensis DB27]